MTLIIGRRSLHTCETNINKEVSNVLNEAWETSFCILIMDQTKFLKKVKIMHIPAKIHSH